MISEKQSQWRAKLIAQIANDLKSEFPEIKGLSRSNLMYCRQFYLFYKNTIVQQPVGPIGQPLITQIPWVHNILIFSKSKDISEAHFYLQKTIANAWSRDTLALQLKSGLFQRTGKAITNFKQTLPEPLSELAQQTLKDPYVFDFMTLAKPYHERDIENQIIKHITKFLLRFSYRFIFLQIKPLTPQWIYG